MKFTCTQENLAQGLATVAHIASKNTNLPILNNILMKATQGGIELAATNLEIGIITRVRGKVEREGSFTVPARIMAEYIALLPQEQITVELDGTSLLLQSGSGETKLRGMVAEEFPLIPKVTSDSLFACAGKEFRDAVGQVLFAAATDDTRPEISGVYLHFSEKTLTMAATDSYRLAECSVALTQNEQEKTLSVIIPAKTLQELVRLVGQGDETVSFSFTPNQALFLSQESELTSRLVDGQYPDYKQIIPDHHTTQVVVETSALLQAVRATSLFSRPGINDLLLELNPDTKMVTLRAANAQVGENRQEVPASIEGETNSIVFNSRYLLDALSNVGAERVVFSMVNNAAPGIFRGEGEDRYLSIIMPIKQ